MAATSMGLMGCTTVCHGMGAVLGHGRLLHACYTHTCRLVATKGPSVA